MKARLKLQKYNYLKFLSHLELIKLMERVLRMNDIPLIFSEGFNPRPKMNFALPSAVGVTTEEIYMDVEVEDISIDKLKNLSFLPEGLEILDAKFTEDVPLMGIVDACEFEIRGDLESLKEAIETTDWMITKKVKRKFKEINTKERIREMEFMDDYLRVVLDAGSRSNLRPDDFLRGVLGDIDKIYDYDLRRKRLFDQEMNYLWER